MLRRLFPDDAIVLATLLPTDASDRMRRYDLAVARRCRPPVLVSRVLGTRPDRAPVRDGGMAVMRAGLRRAAADGLPAVLETSNPANVQRYQRAGWQVVRQMAADPLTISIMEHSSADRIGAIRVTATHGGERVA